jgi:chlorinating enzyme
MTYLSSNQLKQYEDKGFVSPINIFSKDKAKQIRDEIEMIEKEMPGELEKSGRYNAHLISPLLDEVTHNPKILDVVQSLIGQNILVCGTTLFIKNPNEKGFVSYHQDAKYIGLDPFNWVTAWVAITDSNEHNGCMRMWAGSHKENLKQHDQKFNKGNLLTRGQTIKDVPRE